MTAVDHPALVRGVVTPRRRQQHDPACGPKSTKPATRHWLRTSDWRSAQGIFAPSSDPTPWLSDGILAFASRSAAAAAVPVAVVAGRHGALADLQADQDRSGPETRLEMKAEFGDRVTVAVIQFGARVVSLSSRSWCPRAGDWIRLPAR